MKHTFLIFFLSVFMTPSLFADTKTCKWCIENDLNAGVEVLTMAKQKPDEILKSVRQKSICVVVLESRRRSLPGEFTWGEVEKSKGPLSEVTSQKALMGKSLCKGEHPIAKECPTIVLATDAPKSTLLHEYLHIRQIQKDASWCEISQKLWSRTPNEQETTALEDREWDVRKFLWKHRQKMDLNLTDKIAITGEILESAQLRQSRDPSATEYVTKENAAGELRTLLKEFKEQLLQKKAKKS